MDVLSIAIEIGERFTTESQKEFSGSPFGTMVRSEWPQAFYEAIPEISRQRIYAKASVGMGQWSTAPFMAFLDDSITTSPQRGYYPVILYERGFGSFCLVMAQGADRLKNTFGSKGALAILKSRVPHIRSAAPGWEKRGFTCDTFQTYSRGNTNEERNVDDPWAISVAFGKRYFIKSPPPLAEFVDDIQSMLQLYGTVVASIGSRFLEEEQIAEDLNQSGELPSVGAAVSMLDGALKVSRHKMVERRVRNTKLVKNVKTVLGSTCQGCGSSLASTYGNIGADFIEAHHLVPISQAPDQGTQLSPTDFAVLCPTCHRIIHKLGCPALSILRATVNPTVRDFHEKLSYASIGA